VGSAEGRIGAALETGVPWQAEAIALTDSLDECERDKAAETVSGLHGSFFRGESFSMWLADGGEPRQIVQAGPVSSGGV